MGLVYPHEFRQSSSFGEVSDKNLRVLVAPEKKSDVLTQVANEAYKEYSKAKVGVRQQITKWAASSAAFFGTAASSVAAAGGITYWVLRTPINNMVRTCTQGNITAESVAACAHTCVDPFINNESFISQELPFVGSYASWFTPLKISAVIAALTAVDVSVGDRIGIRPIRGCANLAKTMVKSWFIYTSYKAGEVTTKYFERKEAEKDKIRARTHKVIFEQSLGTFNALAERLMHRLKLVDDNPKTLISLKRDIEKLSDKMPWIRQSLATHSLDKSEVQQTIDKLLAAIQTIKSRKLELRVPASERDTLHNIEFLLTTSEEDIQKKGLAIPAVVEEELNRAKEASLGMKHAVKSAGAAVAKGTLAGLVVGTVIPAITAAAAYAAKQYGSSAAWDNAGTCYANLSNALPSGILNELYAKGMAPESQCRETAGLVGATIVLALLAAAGKGYTVISQAKKERKEADLDREAHYEKALSDLNTIYFEMLVYLEGRSSKSDEKAKIAGKLPAIRKQVEKVFGADAWAVKELQDGLGNIRRPNG